MKRLLLLVAVFTVSSIFISNAQTSLKFDGIDNHYVDAGTVSLTSYTKEAWVLWDGTPGKSHNIISGSKNGSDHALWIVADKFTSGHDGFHLDLSDPTVILPNVWYHVAVTYDGITGKMIIYRNGVEAQFVNIAPGFVLEEIFLGSFELGSSDQVAVLAGQLDDVRIWDYVRTEAEILGDLNNCLIGSEPGLVSLYRFEDGTGSTTLIDSAALGGIDNGTLINMNPATDWVTGHGICQNNPTVIITSADGLPTNNASISIVVNFDKDVTGFDASDVSVGNGNVDVGSFTAISASEYTLEVIPTISDGVVTVNIAAAAAQDSSGFGNGAAEELILPYDTTIPTVEITSTEGSSTNNTPFPVTITFSEDVVFFFLSNITVGNGTAGNFTAISGAEYTIEVTPAAEGLVTVDVAAGIEDTAGNTNAAPPTFSIDYDVTAPTSTVSINDALLIAGETATVTITFSEAVEDFDNTDLTFTNGTLTAVSSTDGGITFTGTFTPTVDVESATNVITLDNTVVTDVAGNAGSGTTDSGNYAVDTLVPTSTVSIDDASLTSGDTAIVTITFSEVVEGFDNSDLDIANGMLTDVISTDGGITFTGTFTPTVDVESVTNVITLDNTGVTDVSGNAGSGTTDSGNYTIDTLVPTSTVSIDDASLISGEEATVTITFNVVVEDFDNTDLTFTNGTLTAVSSTDGGITFTGTFTPTVDVESATNVITLDNTGVTDVSGNAGSGTTDSGNYAVDTLAPTSTVSIDDASLISGETATVTITFSEAVEGFDNLGLDIANGMLTEVSSADGGIIFTGTFTPTADLESATNVITLDNAGVTDVAGNTGAGTTDSGNYAIDTLAPTSTVSIDDVSLIAGETATVTITFSEAVEGFDNLDLDIANGMLTEVSSEDGGITFTGTFTPTVDLESATNVIILDNTGVTDVAGNVVTGITDSGNYIIDTLIPTVVISSSETSPTNESPFTVIITFSESVTGFDMNDLIIGNGVTTFFGGSGTTYLAAITPSSNGMVTVDIPVDSATDATLNGNMAATQFSIEYDGSLKLSVKVFLQGPLLNPATPGLMNDILREDNHLPITSPYADALMVNSNVFDAGGASGTGLATDNIVDWVWVELRDSIVNTTVISSQSALLQRDGDVVGIDGVSPLSINAMASNYYIVLKHRNHLGAMSLATVALNASSATVVDFTDSAFSTFGSNAQILLSTGDTALWAGDVNGNGQARYLGPGNDTAGLKDAILNPVNGNPSASNYYPYTGYDNADIDMNGQVRYLGPGNDASKLKDIILLHPGNTTLSNFFPLSGQTPN